ncbi:MAG: helix-turn-helix domain-containing protein [Granulosicoccus sp.]
MNPTERTLLVLEYIMAAGPGPLKQVDIARDCSLPASTLNRILKSLSDWGYLFRTSEKYVVRNFRLGRNVPMSEGYLAKLDDTIRVLSTRLNVCAEVVVVAGHELLWHSTTDHPDPSIELRAGVGFRRSLYEFDVLSRLYLSRLSWSDLEAQFFTDGFFETPRVRGRMGNALSASKVKRCLAQCRNDVFSADETGNHVGIRRFATVIQDASGNFLHLLALAESAKKVKGSIDVYNDALLEARNELTQLVLDESAATRMQPKYHSKPMRGG